MCVSRYVLVALLLLALAAPRRLGLARAAALHRAASRQWTSYARALWRQPCRTRFGIGWTTTSTGYAFEGLRHAMICGRAAWLYQRLSKSAPLHGLTIAMFPSTATYWAAWAVCPQVSRTLCPPP